jgi:hypothetical protein
MVSYRLSRATAFRLVAVGSTVLGIGASGASAATNTMRVVNYAPVNQSVTGMWTNWQPSVLQGDLSKIAGLHANAVRVFTPRDACFPSLCATSQSELSSFVSMANGDGLRVWLTLSFWSPASIANGQTLTPDQYATVASTYASAVVSAFAGRTDEIAALEVYNEIIPSNWNITNPTWQHFVEAVMPNARQAAGGIPVTISAGGGDSPNTNFGTLVNGLNTTSGQPDFYDYHYYYYNGNMVYDPGTAKNTLVAAQQIAGNVPVAVGETGRQTDCYAAYLGGCASSPQQMILCGKTTYPKWIDGGSTLQQSQSSYLDGVEQGALQAGLGAAGVWTLNDQPQSCSNPNGPMLFGLYAANGAAKPAVATVTNDFIAAGG